MSYAKVKYVYLTLVLLFYSCNSNSQTTSSNIKKEESSITSLPNKADERSDAVTCGLLDRNGTLWFGTNNEGIYSYDGKSFTNYSIKNGLCNNKVNCITEDSEGNLWLGTSSGICFFDRKTFTQIPIPRSDTSGIWLEKVYPVVNPNEVLSILHVENRSFWLGTNGAGAYYYDGKTFTHFLSNIGAIYADSLQHNIIQSIAKGPLGNTWFTSISHGGVSRYKDGEFKHFMPKDGLSDDMVRTCFMGRNGDMWFGYNGNRNSGLDRFDGKSFYTLSEKDGLCNKNIRCIYEDKKGNLWLGSGRNGICIYDGKHFKKLTSSNGENFDGILFIIEDTHDNIWFGGTYGKLYSYDGKSITDHTRK